MANSFSTRVFKLATAPARFALKQTRTNIKTLLELQEDFRAYESILQKAAEETVENVVSVLIAAERSLPADIDDMTPNCLSARSSSSTIVFKLKVSSQ